jgi:precorrin-6Y C5,15-methyltransferase (decarboxylating) CbiT subunit
MKEQKMKDELFIRGNIPMTKSEVRAVSISKLELKPDSILYDIGAGTGSVSIEAALAAKQGHVYAFEQKQEGCELIAQNAEKFGVHNLTIVSGKAPETLYGLPSPNRVFIGGTGGNMTEILDYLFRTDANLKVVINVIALESLTQIVSYLKEKNLQAETISLQISKAETVGSYHMMRGHNPIYIITIH